MYFVVPAQPPTAIRHLILPWLALNRTRSPSSHPRRLVHSAHTLAGVIWAYSDLNKTSLVNEPMHGFLGGEPSSIFGSELAIGDINGDGTQDLIVASGLLTTQVDIFMDPNGNQVDFITPLSASNITIHAAHTADGFGTQVG